jgi:hypothetical protein
MNKKYCTVEGCKQPPRCRGLCEKHYCRQKRYGTTDLTRSGKGSIDQMGYRQITVDGKQQREHRIIAERAVGHKLPGSVKIHHVDENDRANNKGHNLVICQDRSYHKLLHVRTKAYRATGNPHLRKCSKCGEWKGEDQFYHRSSGYRVCLCKECSPKYQREVRCRKIAFLNAHG